MSSRREKHAQRKLGDSVLSGVYRAVMAEAPTLRQRGRIMLVTLQDARQVEGELITLTGRFEVGDVVFEPWEVEELEDVT